MTWIRLTIIALGIIPPMMVLPLAALLADFGGTGRATLKAVLAHVLDTEVEITGPIDLGWSEGPRATIEGLRISDPDSTREKPLFVLEHGEIRLSFESALSGSLVISLLHLSGMAVNFHRRDDGSSNLAELSESVRREIGSQTTIIPLLGEVLVERAEIEFIDDASGKRARATIERLDQHRDGTAETATISASGTIMEQEFQLRGNTLPVELAIARKAPFPFTLTLTHHLMDLVLDGRLDPFADVPSLDVDFEFSAFSLTEIFEVLAPGIAMQGSLRVTGRVNGNPAKPALRALDLEMLMEGGGGVWLRGEISDARRLSGIDLSGSVEVSTAQPWLRDILDPKIHLPYLMASASISGNAETLELRDLKLVARDEFGASGTAKGQATLSIRDGVKFQRAETEIEITIADTGLSVAKFVPTFSQIGSAVFTGHLRLEPSGGIKLSGGSIAAAEFGGASIDVDGNLGNFPPATLRYAPNLEITLSGQVPRPAALIRLIHAEAPPLGSISFEAKLTGTPDGLSATEVKIEVDGPDGTRLKASGGIKRMKLDGGEPNVDGIELRLDVMTPRTDWWTTWAGLTLPDIGPASISGDISGGFPAARIDNLVISAGVADTVQVRATGSISSLDFGTSSGIANDVDLSFEARARNGAFVSTIVGRPIPFVDTITATGRFSGGGSRFAITEFLVENKGRGDFSMQARGSIGDVLAGHGVELHVTAAADSALLTNLATAGALGRLRLTGRVVDQGGAIGVEELRIWVEDNDAWAMEASGQIGDLRAADDISLRLRAEIPDPTAFSLTLGRQPTSLAALSFTGNLTGSIQQIEATGVAQIGATKLETIASGDFGGKRPAFVGRIHSERVDLADLGYDATDGPETKQNPSPAEHPSAGRMFPADPLPFDALGLAELKLEIMIEEVTGTALKIDRVISSIRLQDGVLDIDPLHFHFVGGNLVTNAQVHATGSTAALTISAEAHNLDLETAFRSLGAGDPMDGDLDLIAQFSANGDSPRALIESLDGTLDIAMSQGRVHGASFNIWSEDLLSWLLSAEAIQGNTPVHCLVVRLDTQGGRAKLDKFILDVPHQTIWGTGVIDLVGERVDLMFVPRHKGLALPRFTTPAAFRGPLAMPEIELDPVELTSDVLGRIVFSPITALGDFLTTITNSASAEDHGCAKN